MVLKFTNFLKPVRTQSGGFLTSGHFDFWMLRLAKFLKLSKSILLGIKELDFPSLEDFLSHS